jgi:hypothetical protein
MTRKRILQIVLGIVGTLFLLGVFGLTQWNKADVFPQMLAAVYATLGLFLLLTIRNPSAHRSLISFTAWSSIVHGGVMAVQALKNLIPRVDLLRAVLPLIVVGVLLIVLAPEREVQARESKTDRENKPLPSVPTEAARSSTM